MGRLSHDFNSSTFHWTMISAGCVFAEDCMAKELENFLVIIYEVIHSRQ